MTVVLYGCPPGDGTPWAPDSPGTEPYTPVKTTTTITWPQALAEGTLAAAIMAATEAIKALQASVDALTQALQKTQKKKAKKQHA